MDVDVLDYFGLKASGCGAGSPGDPGFDPNNTCQGGGSRGKPGAKPKPSGGGGGGAKPEESSKPESKPSGGGSPKPESKPSGGGGAKPEESSKPSEESSKQDRKDRESARNSSFGSRASVGKKLDKMDKEALQNRDWSKSGVNDKDVQSAVNAYSAIGSGYKDMNGALRQGKGFEGIPKDIRKDAENLQKLAQQPLKKPQIVYRGVSKEVFDKQFAGLTKGQEIATKGFASTSTSSAIAKNFSGGGQKGDVLLEIKAKTGAYIADKSAVRYEYEMVQAHGTKYRMVGIEQGKKGLRGDTIVMLEEI